MSRTSPTLRRRRLARELRQRRLKAGISVDKAARAAGVAKSTLQRWEATESSVQLSAVALLLRFYGADEAEIDTLSEVARDARRRGWWLPWNDVIPSWAVTYIGLESEAAEVMEFQPLLVPGLLQTEGYAEAIFRAAHPDESDEHIKRRVELRMLRQQREDDVKLSVVIGEGALRIPVGGSDVMRLQHQRLIEVANEGRYNLHVLPATAREHASMMCGFIMLRFREPVDVPLVYLEAQAVSLYLEEEADIEHYASLYEHLSAVALSVRDSVRMISEIAETI
ncbi:MAG TPA: helix-turn-helix transcriptional regulator [Micromonosporaceae bacterium]